MAYIFFYIQGVGCLFAWNAFITVTAYFAAKLKGSYFENNFESYFAFGFQLMNISMLILANRFSQRFSVQSRIKYPLMVNLVIFVVITAMVKMDITGNSFFTSTLILVVLSAGCTSWFQGGLFGLSGMMPFRYTQALMAGQGLAGVSIATLNVITTAAFPVSSNSTAHHENLQQENAAFLFFLISLAISVASIFTFFWLLRLPVVKYHCEKVRVAVRRASTIASEEFEGSINGASGSSCSRGRPTEIIYPMAIQVAYIFFITLSVFPAIAANVQSEYANKTNATPNETRYANKYFVPVYCFIMFNVGDLTGRSLASSFKWPTINNPKLMWLPVLLRTAFIPLFMFCNVQFGGGEINYVPSYFQKDWVPYVLMLLLGSTNGYWGTLLMMYGPSSVNGEDMEWAGSTMLLFLVIGLTSGSFFSFPLRAIMCRCNPFINAASTSNTTDTSDLALGGEYGYQPTASFMGSVVPGGW